MAVVQGTQIRIPVARRQAAGIIERMVQLLNDRYHTKVTRRQFMRRWSSLRRQLFITEEYQLMRVEVLSRNGGRCELCSRRASVHVHHLDPVAYAPRRVLLTTNVQAVCRECHNSEHRHTTNHARHYQTLRSTTRLAHSPTTPNSASPRGGAGLSRGPYAKEA